jgi:hypothetical protein
MEYKEMFFTFIGIFIPSVLVISVIISLVKRSVDHPSPSIEAQRSVLQYKIRIFLNEMDISFGEIPEPHIQWDHVDGPLLHTSTFGFVWLTWWDRLLLWIKLSSLYKLDIHYCHKEMSRFYKSRKGK